MKLCNALAAMCRKLCTEFVDPHGLQALVACCLIPLDKCPGLRLIGIGETFRRIMAKSIMAVVKDDVQYCVGSLQVCAGQEGAAEGAVHAMCSIFQSDDTDCVLLVDATNAFNTLNRQATLHNACILCQSIATVLINTYRSDVLMYVIGGETIHSVEGITQGYPLAMSMYAIGILPLITTISGVCKQVWFADDATGAGSVDSVRTCWNAIIELGPAYGYHANAFKTWLIVKEDRQTQVQRCFEGSGIHMTTAGKRHLGAALGSPLFVEEYVNEKVYEQVSQVIRLSDISITQPHAAYAATACQLSGFP